MPCRVGFEHGIRRGAALRRPFPRADGLAQLAIARVPGIGAAVAQEVAVEVDIVLVDPAQPGEAVGIDGMDEKGRGVGGEPLECAFGASPSDSRSRRSPRPHASRRSPRGAGLPSAGRSTPHRRRAPRRPARVRGGGARRGRSPAARRRGAELAARVSVIDSEKIPYLHRETSPRQRGSAGTA